MKIKLSAPTFQIGDVIDLSYKTSELPNRVLVRGVVRHEQHDEWMYECLMESTGEAALIGQSFLTARKTAHTSPVYRSKIVQERIMNGFRFCGNMPHYEARAFGEQIKHNDNIEHIYLYPALDGRGALVPDKLGIWVKYTTTIDDDGVMADNTKSDIVTKVK